MKTKRGRYSEYETLYLKENYHNTSTENIAKHLNRDIFSIRRKAGELKLRKISNFIRGKVKSKIEKKEYGMLTPIKQIEINKPGPGRWWECRCKCGKIKNVRASELISKGVQSCGCLKHHRSKCWKGIGDISKTTWGKIIWHAKQRKIEFSITIEFGWELFLKQNGKCAITNIPIKFCKTQSELPEFKDVATASLDRIDSKRGYTEDNVWWVHKDVNVMKWHKTMEEFIYICNLIAKQHPVEIN